MNSIILSNANSQGLGMIQYLKMLNCWGAKVLPVTKRHKIVEAQKSYLWQRGDIIFREDYQHRAEQQYDFANS